MAAEPAGQGAGAAEPAGQGAGTESWRPVVYGPEDDVEALIASGAARYVHDTLLDQLGELVETRAPGRRFTAEERRAAVEAMLEGTPPDRYGRWVFYPWSGRLVHLLPPAELREVRTDRNRYKITDDEQRLLATKSVGVIGLSVGQAAAITLALEGVGGRLRLADFDTVALSNLNRLRAGIHELGLPKAWVAARAIAEIDPYVDVEIFPEGVRPGNLDAFLDGLHLLIEECDDLLVKLLVRERARALRVPVLMDTSDRGLLDVERFDREPDRPILHGLVGDLRADQLRGLSTRDKIPFVLRILGEEALSPRFAASLPEVRETISTWPQLASGVALGGALVADTARRVLLGSFTRSGRFYVDLEAIVSDAAGSLADALGPTPPSPPLPESRIAERTVRLPTSAADTDALIEAACLAPSGHNVQPWRFRPFAEGIDIRFDPARRLPALDHGDGGAWAALGAAAYNLELVARAAGLAPRLLPFPDPDDPLLAVRVTFGSGPPDADPLLPWIGRRVTNRRLGARVPLGDDGDRLAAEATAEGSRLRWVSAPEALAAIGDVLGAVDRLSWLFRPIHHEIFAGMRWTSDEVSVRHGLDVDALELTAADRAALRMLAAWPRAELLARLGGGRAIEQAARDAIAASSGVFVLSHPGRGPAAYLQGGRAMQRVWLRAEQLGLALHPMNTLPALSAQLFDGALDGWDSQRIATLREIEARYRVSFPREPDAVEVLLFRVGRAPPPTARSIRRHLQDVTDG